MTTTDRGKRLRHALSVTLAAGLLTLACLAGAQTPIPGTGGLLKKVPVIPIPPLKTGTTLSIRLPTSVLDGQSASFFVDVARSTPTGRLTGVITATFGTTTLGVPVSGEGSPVSARFDRGNLPPGPLPITATYSGDTQHAGSSATATYSVASKTPTVEISTSPASPQVGIPFSIFTRVRVDGNVPGGPSITGPVTIQESGVTIGTADLVTSLTTPTPSVLTSRKFTALSFAPLRLAATFAGDTVYRSASSPVIAPVVQKAQPSLSLTATSGVFTPPPTAQPLQFRCGAPMTFFARLVFPPSIGLSNRTFEVVTSTADGSVRPTVGGASGTLIPAAGQLGTAQGNVSVVLPSNSTSVQASFSGDSFFSPATSAPLTVAMRPVPVKVQFLSLPSIATNPLVLSVAVANDVAGGCIVSEPEGTVEFFDGASSLGIVQLPRSAASASQIIDGTSNTIQLGEASTRSARLTVSRPLGISSFKARYFGDPFHQAGESQVVPVTFR